MPRTWTKEMDKRLVEMYEENVMSLERIAIILGVSRWDCYVRLKQLGVYTPNRQWKKVCQRCGTEFTTSAKAARYCSEKCKKSAANKRQYIKRKERKLELPQAATTTLSRQPHPYPLVREYTDTSDMLIAQCLLEGATIEEMAKLLGRDQEDLKSHIEQAQKRIAAWQKYLIKKWGAQYYEKKRLRREAAANV